jgi:internalin A
MMGVSGNRPAADCQLGRAAPVTLPGLSRSPSDSDSHFKNADLTTLNLASTDITDAGLKELRHFKSLRWLNLFGTKITDASLQYLGDLENLTSLYLNQTEVTDKGLQALRRLKNLKHLTLSQTETTTAGANRLKQFLTEANID